MTCFSIFKFALFLSSVLSVSRAFPATVASLINSSVDPCDDFYQFSCGAWLATHKILPDEAMVEYSFDMAHDAMAATVIQALGNDSTSLAGILYASCMDMEARNAIGSEPLLDKVESILKAQDKHELFAVAGRLARTGADFITNFSPDSSLRNGSHNILWVKHADLTLDDEYYKHPLVLEHVEKNLSRYASTLLDLVGFQLDTTEYDNYGDVALGVEKQLIELQLYTRLDPTSADVYYLFKYKEAAENYPFVFGAYAEGMQLLDDAPALTDETEVALLSIAYFEKAEELVSLISLDALKVYIAFNYINGLARYLSKPFVEARFEFFRRVMLGVQVPSRLEKICAANVVELLPVHAGVVYVAHRDDIKETGDAFIAMLDEILDAMTIGVETLEWLDDKTRASALAKLDSLEVMHVQPDPVQLAKEAEGLTKLDPAAFFANVDLIHTAQFGSLARAIESSVDRSEWGMSAVSANAYYTPFTNQIVFPAGIMQKPFFDPSSTAAQMFGAMGVIAGHEISHGFDDSGSNFDALGNWNSWWTNKTTEGFESRAQCLVDQYNSFYVDPEDGVQLVPVNGKKTLGENIADNGGLHVAFKAYETRMSSNSDNNPDDQLFFVSFAQSWCGKVRDKTALNSFLTNKHAAGEARVNGAVMNSAAFAKAFECPTGAPMNPVDKCVLWSKGMDDENDRTRGQRYEDTKRELLAVLGAGSMDESTRKRQFVKLFDHFRSDYTQLSVKLRENIRLQRRLLGKCLQTKNELVACAQKAKDAQQVQADEMKNLVYYRDECEHAWKQNALSQERERDAMNMIDELKTKMEDLQSQLQAVMVNGLPSPSARRHPHDGSCPDLSRSTPLSTSSKLQPPRLASPASSVSPVKRIKYQTNESSTMPPMLSFEEWKLATKVWCPATPLSRGSSSRAASTPSKAAAHTLEHQHATNRCVSVPSLHMTPMERVNLSQQQQRVKPAAIIRAETAPAQVSALIRQGGTPAIKRRVPRQLPHVY